MYKLVLIVYLLNVHHQHRWVATVDQVCDVFSLNEISILRHAAM